jgi:multidrug transporter EmrE-like cation transporter
VLTATLLAVGSAVVHAGWNLLIKTSDDRELAGWGVFAGGALLGGVALLVVGGPGWEALPYLAGTGLVHIAYAEALVAAYHHGDFSLAYPIARGGGAVLAAVAAVVVLDDRLPAPAWLAIGVAAGGLALLSTGSAGRAAGLAAATAACIATYTLIDSAGARAVDSGLAYGLASCTTSGLTLTVANLARPARRARLPQLLAGWRRHLAGGAATVVAYTMVLVAVRRAPVGYVTMLRESSVVIGPLLGWMALREPLGRRRVAPSAVVFTGLVLLVATAR